MPYVLRSIRNEPQRIDVICSILKETVSYVVSIVKLPQIPKILAARKRIVVFYVGQLIVGKIAKASKKFCWRFVMFLIPDKLSLQFKRSKLRL